MIILRFVPFRRSFLFFRLLNIPKTANSSALRIKIPLFFLFFFFVSQLLQKPFKRFVSFFFSKIRFDLLRSETLGYGGRA
ncbi:hypothetical protein CMV_020266 [Castanea mollissima]|uniref:Uncharacterized protein n=1 Tax=Castanea mollissima TaxID=60419 RepID=A0A8J4QR01_9ROSI|nr:hypothetical protein CMV_020266 [Castanea mollissima]